ncbi:MAG: SGNH/GDSL hydrolase family protein [Deltaproteobacteria bacterium]|nr:SGNH/GDSL hydrolase family protein [Nannocystaceae bacterium]
MREPSPWSLYTRCLFALLLPAACGQTGDDDDGADSATDGASTSSASASMSTTQASDPTVTATGPSTTAPTTTAPNTTTVDDTGESGDSSETGIDPGPPAVHYVGRYDDSDPSRVRLGWSGVGFVVRFDGTGVTARIDDAGQYMTVVIDGEQQANLVTAGGEQDFVIATGLPAGEHVVEVYRRTEGSFGVTTVLDVTVEGELLPPPVVDRRIEIVGDSITAGYGNEGVSPCGFSAETENHFMTYGAIAARTVGAELSTVAWSGKGIIFNYGEDTNQPMPTLYDRTVAVEEAGWDHAAWQPDVVVVNLGTNDFSTEGDPSEEQYVGTYVEFAAHLREVNPEAFILLVSPSLFGEEVGLVDGYLQSVVAQRQQAGDDAIATANINVDWIGSGCDGHPSIPTHEGMAARLVEELGTHVGW